MGGRSWKDPKIGVDDNGAGLRFPLQRGMHWVPREREHFYPHPFLGFMTRELPLSGKTRILFPIC